MAPLVLVGGETRLNPSAGEITAGFWRGRSPCGALQVQVRKKLGRGAQLAGPNNYIKRVSDVLKVQFRTESFNVLNCAHFAPPLDHKNIFDAGRAPLADAGMITSAQTPSRQIQFALEVVW